MWLIFEGDTNKRQVEQLCCRIIFKSPSVSVGAAGCGAPQLEHFGEFALTVCLHSRLFHFVDPRLAIIKC
jgi:hypothetical protein